MRIRPTLLSLALGVLASGVLAGAASAETRWEHRHPRQDQVLDRAAHLRREIRTERREGEIGAVRAHRLLAADRRIAREDQVIARANGGYITRREQRFLNRQETGLARRVDR